MSSWTIVSIGLTATTCTLTLSIAPYQTVLDFGTGAGAAVQFVQPSSPTLQAMALCSLFT